MADKKSLEELKEELESLSAGRGPYDIGGSRDHAADAFYAVLAIAQLRPTAETEWFRRALSDHIEFRRDGLSQGWAVTDPPKGDTAP